MLTTQPIILDALVTASDRGFYRALGQRLAGARKAADLTQVQLAEQLGIAQQTLAHYEGGKLRVAVALLPHISRVLAVSVEELIGDDAAGAKKRGPTPQLQQKIERLTSLPKAQQKLVLQMLDGVLAQAAR